jgi:hypothetical protein
VQVYIGDGATLRRSFVRKRGDTLIGMLRFTRNSAGARKKAFHKPSSLIAAQRLSSATSTSWKENCAVWPPSAASKHSLPTTEWS